MSDDEDAVVTYTSDLEKSLKKCDEETTEEQPLYIDKGLSAIKCKWCPASAGSQHVKVVNQHIRKAKSHTLAGTKELPPDESRGVQLVLTDFFKPTLTQFASIKFCVFYTDLGSNNVECSSRKEGCSILTESELASNESPHSAGTVALDAGSETPLSTSECKGIYHRRYAELHFDRSCGTTTAKKLWEEKDKCNCCVSYKVWKETHPQLAQHLLEVQTMENIKFFPWRKSS